MIVKRSLFATIGFGIEGQSLDSESDAPLTQEEQELADTVEENANLIDTDIQALEDMEAVANAMEDQVLQNEVNLASIQGEEVPAQGEEISVTEQVENVSNEGDVVTSDVVIAEGQAPEVTLTQDSSTAEIQEATDEVRQGLESMSVLISNTGAFKEGGLMSIKTNSVNRNNVYNIGIESIVNNPVQSYKQACLNYSVGLLSVKETIVNFFKSLFEKIKEFFNNLSIIEKMTLSRARKVSERFKNIDLNTTNISVTGNGSFLTFFNHGGIEGFAQSVVAVAKTLEDSVTPAGGLVIAEKLDKVRSHLDNVMTNSYVAKLYQDLVKYGLLEEVDYEMPCAIPTSPSTVAVFGKGKQSGGYEITKMVLSHDAKNQMISNEQGAKLLLDRIKNDCSNIESKGRMAYNGIRNIKKSMEVLAATWDEMAKVSMDNNDNNDAIDSKVLMNICKFGTKFMFMASRTYPTFVKCTEIALSWVQTGNNEGQGTQSESKDIVSGN